MKASARAIEARHAARNALDRGDEAAALQESLRALVYGDSDPATLELFELLAVSGDPVPAAELLGDALETAWGDWPPETHCRLAALRFDLLRGAGAADRDMADAAVQTLEAAAGGVRHEAAWDPVADPDRRAALLGAIAGSQDAVAAALEHLAWAPKRAGIHADALRFAEQAAWGNAAEPALVRAAERLLHDLARSGGPEASAARDAARRLEAMRKQQRPAADRRPTAAPAPMPDLAGRCIVVVGGHDGLRAAILRDLRDLGPGELREIPPTWEGQRGGGVEPTLRGADLAVLVIRQLDHSTGDRAEAAARELGVAVRRARSASVAAVRDAVLDWARPR